jgi:hypothetical protein
MLPRKFHARNCANEINNLADLAGMLTGTSVHPKDCNSTAGAAVQGTERTALSGEQQRD